MAGTKKPQIDPATGPTMVLRGRVVTMNATNTVVPNGCLYIKEGSLVAVQDAAAPLPAGFGGIALTDVGGTIYPGLIELHNHLAYNALRLWQVPKAYSNRDQWSGIPEYRERVSGPMTVLGKTPKLLPPLIRYVEAKCLVAGTTTSQGVALFSNSGVRRYYRGVVRNVEATDEAALPEAETRIADIEASTAAKFLERVKKETCFLLHLSEGVDPTARKHFQALQISADRWAITSQLAGIHAAGLTAEDLKIYGDRGGAMIWSPMSNLLLYGDTAKVKAAKTHGVRIGLGSDWSPSGSKNLLGELKVAKLYSQNVGGLFSSRELLAMATRTAAAILQWGAVLGSLEAGKRADLLIVAGSGGDPYDHLIDAKETDVSGVIINGVPRFGTAALFSSLGVSNAETIKIGGQSRRVYLKQDTQDPLVGKISLSSAMQQLAAALRKLPKLAKALEKPITMSEIARRKTPHWQLALDEIEFTGSGVRPKLLFGYTSVGAHAFAGAGTKPLSQIVKPLVLDPLTVADDAEFLAAIATQRNAPNWLKSGLATLY